MWCINIKKRIRKSSDLVDIGTDKAISGKITDAIDGLPNGKYKHLYYVQVISADSPNNYNGFLNVYKSNNNWITVEAVTLQTGQFYTKTKSNGVWGEWKEYVTNSDLTAKIGSNIKKINYDWDNNNPKFLVTDANGATFYAPLTRK